MKNDTVFTTYEDSRKYPGQQCQDEETIVSFRKLHLDIVNLIIDWCKDHNITIDEFHLNADCLEDSIKAGSWQSCTDSGLTFMKFSEEYKDVVSMKKIVSDNDWKVIKSKQEPFLISI